MVILLGVLAGLVLVVVGVLMRMAQNAASDSHGAMSDQWLAEHRASHNRPLGD